MWYKVFLAYLILFCSVRVGEASHPGPQSFVIGAINPTGLLGKANHIAALQPGVYGISETHLSSLGVRQFRREMQSHRIAAKYLSSKPAPLIRSSVGVIGGKCTGVGFVSHHPGRNLPVTWPEELHQEARTHVAGFCIQGTWIKVGVVYGYAHRPTNVATQSKTDQLLSLVVDRIANECSGPRIIMGDWNQPYGTLTQEKLLVAKGFVEVQVLAKAMWNRTPENTCKNSTIKDYIWISPELIPNFLSVDVDPHAFPDHAVITARFKHFSDQLPVQIWPKPAPLPWDQIESQLPEHEQIQINPDRVEEALVEVMAKLEDGVHQTLCQKGKLGLVSKQRGRCRHTDPVKGKHPIPTLNNGRANDHQPQFMGENYQHYMWLKQLRRIQSLVRILHPKSGGPLSTTHIDHGTKLWEVIRRGPGFPKSFAEFWQHRSVILPKSPCTLPHSMPSPEIAMIIHTTFEMEFRQLEKSLWAKRHSSAKASRLLDTNKVFSDVAKPMAMPVQTLIKSNIASIAEISDDGCNLTFEQHDFKEGHPIYGPHGILQVRELQPHKVVLEHPGHLEPGNVVHQKEEIGQSTKVTREFENLWLSHWNRHNDTGAKKWQPFITMMKQFVPPSHTPMQMPPLTLQTWRKAVCSKKRRSAIGPDGVSRSDLIKMSDSGASAIVNILTCIENGSAWPVSLVTGLISMLEKKEDAEAVTDFRPICIFSAIYRTWASIRARQILRYLAQIAPEELVGSRPRKETADIWWTISLQIEASLFEGHSLAGATADICKCFNALPRVPVTCLAEWLGIPSFFTKTWLRALTTMERRFVINGQVGRPLHTNRGYPEGDPLSVCAMFLVNIALHNFLSAQQPSINLWTFVDDWQFTGEDENDIDKGFSHMKDFTEMLDLTLDQRKCFVWGTTAAIRDGFRRLHKNVKRHERNLGGHISYCKVPTNYTLRDRIASFESTWTWLKKSKAPLNQRLKIVTVVAWPRCLHGIANIPLGAEHFAKLRSRVMQSLAWQKKGANPLVQVSLIHGVKYDPGYFALISTVKAFRRFSNPTIAFPLVDALSQTGQHLRCPGPCGIFLTRLFDVGWSWLGSGYLLDHEGIRCHIYHTAMQIIEKRLQHAWICRIGSLVAVRNGFQGMEFVSPSLTLPQGMLMDSEDGGLLRTVLNGTFFTRDKQIACGTVPTVLCPFCQSPDSIMHRHYSCQYFQDLRSNLPGHLFTFLEEAPQCTIQHGWFCEPEEVRLLRFELDRLPDLTEDFIGIPDGQLSSPIHMFCDGSCIQPTVPELRVATWGVCLANLEEDEFYPLAQGPVWGVYQSSTRAEFTAAIASVKFALHIRMQCWIWTDNQTVFDFLNNTWDNSFSVSSMEKDHDLRETLLSLSRKAQQQHLLGSIIKVRSHMKLEAFTDLIERWAIRGNEFADQCAERARLGFHPSFWKLWEAAFERVHHIGEMRKLQHKFFIDVGQRVISQKDAIWEHDDEAREAMVGQPAERDSSSMMSWLNIPDSYDFGVQAGNGYRTLGSMAITVFHWLTQLVSSDEGVTAKWVCNHQLLTLFQAMTGKIGVKHLAAKRTFTELASCDVDTFSWYEMVKDFGTFLRAITKQLQLPYHVQKRRPSGTSFQCRPSCILIRIKASHISVVDEIFLYRKVAPIKDASKAFRDFIVVERQPGA